MKKAYAAFLMLLVLMLVPSAFAEEAGVCSHENAVPMTEFHQATFVSREFSENPVGCEWVETRQMSFVCQDCGWCYSENVSRSHLNSSHSVKSDGKCDFCGMVFNCEHPADKLYTHGGVFTYTHIPVNDSSHRIQTTALNPYKVECFRCGQDVTDLMGERVVTYGDLLPHWYENGVCKECGHKEPAQAISCDHFLICKAGEENKYGVLFDENHCQKYYRKAEAWVSTGEGTGFHVDYCPECRLGFKDGKTYRSSELHNISIMKREAYWYYQATEHEYENGRCAWCGHRKNASADCAHTNTYEFREEVLTGDTPDPLVCAYYRTEQVSTVCKDCGELLNVRFDKSDEYVEASRYHEQNGVSKTCKHCGVKMPECGHPYKAYDYMDPVPQHLSYWAYSELYHYYSEHYIYGKVRCSDCGFLVKTNYTYEASTRLPHNFISNICVDCGYEYAFELPDCSHSRLLKAGETTDRYGARNGKYACKKYEVTNACWALIDGKQVPCDFCLICHFPVYQGETVINGCANLIPGKGYDGEYTDHEYVNGYCYYCSYVEFDGDCPHFSLAFDNEVLEYVYKANPLGCERYPKLKKSIYCTDCSEDMLVWYEDGPAEVAIGDHNPAPGSSRCRYCGYNTSSCSHPQEYLILHPTIRESETYVSLDEHTHRRTRVCSETDIFCQYCDKDLTNRWNGVATIVDDLPHSYENGVCTDCGHVANKNLPACSHKNLVTDKLSVYLGERVDENFCQTRYYISNSYTYIDGKKVSCDYCLDCGYAVYQGKAVIDGKAVLKGGGSNGMGRAHVFENKVCVYCGSKQAPVAPKSVEIVSDGSATVAVGSVLPLTVRMEPAGAESTLTWSSSDKKIAAVDNQGYVTGVKEGSATITVRTANGEKARLTVKVVDPYKPTGVKLDQTGTVTVSLHATLQLNAILEPATAVSTIEWSSSSKSRATVDENGLVQPLKEGTVTITAETRNGKEASVKVKIVDPFKPEGIKLDQAGTVTLSMYDTLQLNAILEPATAISTIEWDSSSKSRATVDENGVVTPIKEGTVTITAETHNGKEASVKVKIVDPYKPEGVKIDQTGTVTLSLYDTLQLSTTLEPATARSEIKWETESKKYATVDENGLVTPHKEGTTTITARTHNGKKATVKVKVVDPYKPTGVKIDQTGTVTLSLYDTLQLSTTLEPATARSEIEWESSSKSRATVDENGVVTPIKEGTVTITAETHNGKEASVKVKIVDPYKPEGVKIDQTGTVTLSLYDTLQLSTTLEPATARSEIKWETESKKYATVDENGLVTPHKEGTTTITARTHNGKKATVKVKVVDPYKPEGIKIDQTGTIILSLNDTLQLSTTLEPATARSEIEWESSSESRATVNEFGLVTPHKEGTVTITAETHNGKEASVKVKIVDPFKAEAIELDKSDTVDLPINETLDLNYALLPATAVTTVEWSSSNEDRATVDENGVVTPYEEGRVTITVETRNGKEDTVKINIVDPIPATGLNVPEETGVTTGDTFTLPVHPYPTNATSRITLSVDDDDVLRLNADGTFTALKEGRAVVTVRTSSGRKAKINVVV